MNTEAEQKAAERAAAARQACGQALRAVCLAMPHLSGLVHKVRFEIEPRVPTAGVFASGRLVVNPDFALSLKPSELVFVMATRCCIWPSALTHAGMAPNRKR